MRKGLLLLPIILLSLGVVQAQKQTWNLSKNIRATNNEISFDQGSSGVWYFMESASLRHIPLTYSFLPDYQVLCGSPGEKQINGLACWRDVAHMVQELPAVSVNFTSQTQYQSVVIPPHAVHFHPASDRLAIIAWKSPLNAIVKITGGFTDLDPNCGNGVLWSIDRGTQRLAFGDLPNGGARSFQLPAVSVTRGRVLYFILDPKNGDYGCDTTMIDLTIAEVQ